MLKRYIDNDYFDEYQQMVIEDVALHISEPFDVRASVINFLLQTEEASHRKLTARSFHLISTNYLV